MATVRLIEYAEASPEVRAVYDDIMATRRVDCNQVNFELTMALDVWDGRPSAYIAHIGFDNFLRRFHAIPPSAEK